MIDAMTQELKKADVSGSDLIKSTKQLKGNAEYGDRTTEGTVKTDELKKNFAGAA